MNESSTPSVHPPYMLTTAYLQRKKIVWGSAALPKWGVREYRLEDVHGVRELFATVFRHTPPLEHFIWKFHDDPAGRGIIMIAEDSDRIVGQYALMPTWLRLGNEVVLGAQSLDTMTHPNYRNQGVFVTLAKACMELAAKKGVEALYGFTARERAYHGLVHRLNWDDIGDISTRIRFLNPNLLQSRSRLIRQLASLGIPLLPMGDSSPHGIDIRMEPPTEDEIVTLANSVSQEQNGICRIERCIEWVRWRFSPASQRRYVWFSAYRDGVAKAYAVFGIDDWGGQSLIDVSGSDIEALEAVVSRATRYAKECRLPSLLAFATDRNVERALKSCGYFQQRTRMALVVRSMTPRNLEGNIHLHSSWRIGSADSDTF